MTQKQESPFFFYDLDFLEHHLKEMSKVLGPDFKLWYACKANPMSAILKVFRNLNFGIDVASQGELDQALRSGVKPHEILSTGPAKSKKYLRALLENDVNIIVLESIQQALDLNEISRALGKKPKALLRVQLSWDGGGSVLGGGEITPFGIGPDEWEEYPFKELHHIEIIGLHAFQWGNILNLDDLEDIWDRTCKRLTEFSKKNNISLEVLDLGGGIGIPYEEGKNPLQFSEIYKILLKLKDKYRLNKIWMELGRFSVGECGYYFAKVIDKKKVRGKNILVLGGGINHIARPALVGQSFPCQLFRDSKEEKESFQVHGPLCTALDQLGTFELPQDIGLDDWLVFSKVGAYGFTEAMPFFLCHDLPSENIFYKGDFMTPRPSKTSSDWMV
jgi:diaminopimelate decarboxylase